MSCTDEDLYGDRMENKTIKEWGIKQIGNNLYIKQVNVGWGDRLYFLVDSTNKLVGNCSNAVITHGKTHITETIISQ
jgi:hypothetical protein